MDEDIYGQTAGAGHAWDSRDMRRPPITSSVVAAKSRYHRRAEGEVAMKMRGEGRVSANLAVRRGPESWAYIYTTLGFALTIEAAIIAMTPLEFPWNVILYAVIAAITVWLFIDNRWVHQRLISLKLRYENKGR